MEQIFKRVGSFVLSNGSEREKSKNGQHTSFWHAIHQPIHNKPTGRHSVIGIPITSQTSSPGCPVDSSGISGQESSSGSHKEIRANLVMGLE